MCVPRPAASRCGPAAGATFRCPRASLQSADHLRVRGMSMWCCSSVPFSTLSLTCWCGCANRSAKIEMDAPQISLGNPVVRMGAPTVRMDAPQVCMSNPVVNMGNPHIQFAAAPTVTMDTASVRIGVRCQSCEVVLWSVPLTPPRLCSFPRRDVSIVTVDRGCCSPWWLWVWLQRCGGCVQRLCSMWLWRWGWWRCCCHHCCARSRGRSTRRFRCNLQRSCCHRHVHVGGCVYPPLLPMPCGSHRPLDVRHSAHRCRGGGYRGRHRRPFAVPHAMQRACRPRPNSICSQAAAAHLAPPAHDLESAWSESRRVRGGHSGTSDSKVRSRLRDVVGACH